jgi:hypothetical protein
MLFLSQMQINFCKEQREKNVISLNSLIKPVTSSKTKGKYAYNPNKVIIDSKVKDK